jgi:SARP family transcriptional regulator, regulator of embCAB operon
LVSSELRFYLTGRVAVEGSAVVSQTGLPGRQGRLALVYLVLERHRPVPVDELADALWGPDLPPSWERSVRVLVSKLRRALDDAGGGATIVSEAGCYQAMLGRAWVDVEAAVNALDRAEGAWRRGEPAPAWAEATVAAAVTRRPLLPGEDLRWVAEQRQLLGAVRARALEVLASVHLGRGDQVLARAAAEELVRLEPLREAGHRQLMRAHAAGGERAEALRVYGRLRTLLADELGVDPSPETTALHLTILRG